MTPQPLNSAPPQGPVEGRGVAEIRADLALADESEGWSERYHDAIVRLLHDVEPLLAEVEAAHRFERSVAVEREALLGERDSLRGVVQAARDLHRNTGRAGIAGDVCDECDQPWSSGAGPVPAGCPTIRALAAAADAPKPERPTFEQMLNDPNEQFDGKSELLPPVLTYLGLPDGNAEQRAALMRSIEEYRNAPPRAASASAQPADPPTPVPSRCDHGETEAHKIRCDSICDAAAGGACFTPWCKCRCHRGPCPGPSPAVLPEKEPKEQRDV